MLLEHSLLRRTDEAGGADATPRFGMLETVREFAQEQLQASNEAGAIGEAHARYVVGLVEDSEPRLSGPEQVQWMARLAAEQDNLRAALRWLLDAEELEEAGGLLRRLLRFWWVRGQVAEARHWAEEVLARAAPPRARGRACLVVGGAAGIAAAGQVDPAALGLLVEARSLARATGDRWVEGVSLLMEGVLAPAQGDIAAGIDLLRQAQPLLREAGDEWAVGSCLSSLSSLCLLLGELDEAERYAQEHLALAQPTGDLLSLAQARDFLAMVALLRQDLDRAAVLLKQSTALALELGHPQLLVYGLLGLAVVAAERDPRRAMRHFGAAEALRQAHGVALWPWHRMVYDPMLERVRTALGARAFEAARMQGRALTREQAGASGLQWEGASS